MLLYNFTSPKTLVQIPYSVGHERKKIGPRKQGQSSFFRTQLSALRISLIMQTISVYRPAPLLIKKLVVIMNNNLLIRKMEQQEKMKRRGKKEII